MKKPHITYKLIIDQFLRDLRWTFKMPRILLGERNGKYDA